MKAFSYLVAFLIIFTACAPAQETPQPFKTGAEVLVESNFAALSGKNVGLITNHTATVGDRHIADLLHEHEDVNLIALYGPEHGIRGDAPAGDRIDSDVDSATGIVVHSLYGSTYKPSPEMLEGLDVLIFDIQDIGPRFYTYISTMGYGMEAAAENGISFMVLDRPNPLGGELIEGPMLEEGFESFVGFYPIPVTHGLTVGELANMIKAEKWRPAVENLDLHVVEMENWDRSKLWDAYFGDSWNPPSPNIPDFETALVYPGTCLFEGLSAAEGRGTYEPFLMVGAPWADGEALAEELNSRNLPGVRFEAVTFVPESIPGMATRAKFMGEDVNGVRHVVTDAHALRPVEIGIHVIDAFFRSAPEEEIEGFFNRARFGRLAGGHTLEDQFREGLSPEEIIRSWQAPLSAFNQLKVTYHLY